MATRMRYRKKILIEGLLEVQAGVWGSEIVTMIPAEFRIETVRAYALSGQGLFQLRVSEVENPDLVQVIVQYDNVPAATDYIDSFEGWTYILGGRDMGSPDRSTGSIYVGAKADVDGYVKYRIILEEV